MSLSDGARTGYEQVANTVRQAIATGEYAVGSHLPSIQQLADDHGVSHMTVKRALDVLRNDGLIASRAGVRAIVTATPDDTTPPVQEQIDSLRSTVEELTERLAHVEAHVGKSTHASEREP
ncbi:GntR family transcriptional regulator [Jiangella gansuensis]|uniref:GntR family transcriptional regulator n=1 Tax=Jiangella gansuensis TaxID=281473 RepID=UPI00047CD11E|nr:winged helix-turn-helix domain-containing protein [Jiangella gansuensis]